MPVLTGARRGTAEDAVGGVVPGEVVRPGSAEEVVEVLRASAGTVVPVGEGTKTGWAAPPTRCDLRLDLRGLDRVVEHVAGDLVVVAEAGVRLSVLQEQLAGHGQLLGLDPPEPDATLGGIVSANASGPRRLRYGMVRDLLIGVTVVLADGTTASSGGKVVKNVAGYDLGKLYTGAHGSLGVVVSTTWRLHPVAPARRAVVVPVEGTARAGELAQLLVRSTLTPTAVELAWGDGHGELVVLFESIAASVEAQAEQAVVLLGGGEQVDDVPPWFGQRPPGELLLRVAHEPYALPAVLDALPPTAHVTASACTGVAYVGLPDAAGLAGLRAAIRPYDGSAVVLRAPGLDQPGLDQPGLDQPGLDQPGLDQPGLDQPGPLDHWGPVPDSFALMQRVKDRFDPARRLSPGRLLGGM